MNNEESTIIHNIYRNHIELIYFLKENDQLSFISDYNALFGKVLLLSCGSFFEVEITNILIEFATRKSNNDMRLSNFIQRQAIATKYHQLFDWGERDNISKPKSSLKQFLGLFGADFRDGVQKIIDTNEEIQNAIKNFLEIGHSRNIIVHKNLANYSYEKSPEEVFEMFQSAIKIIPFFRQIFLDEKSSDKSAGENT